MRLIVGASHGGTSHSGAGHGRTARPAAYAWNPVRPALPFMYGKLKAPFLAGIALSALNGAREADQARPFEGAFGMAMAGGGGEGGTDAGGGVTGAPSIDTSTAHPARVYDYWPL